MTTQSKKPLHFSFDYNIALKYGSDEAIMIKNFLFWIKKNRERKINFYEARTWTYNSIKTFASVFAFWTKKQVRRIINSLIKQGVLITGNYNKTAYDRTCWYAFKDEDQWLTVASDVAQPTEKSDLPVRENRNAHEGSSKLPIGQMELPEQADLYHIVTTKKKHTLKNNNTPAENPPICEPIVVVSEKPVSPVEPVTDTFQPVPDLTVLEQMNDQDKQLATRALKKITDRTTQAVILFMLKNAIANGIIEKTPLVYICMLINKEKNGLLVKNADLAKMKKANEEAPPKLMSVEEKLRSTMEKHREAVLKDLRERHFTWVKYYGNFTRYDFEKYGLIDEDEL